MPSVVLQQVSRPFARKNAGGTLEKPVGIKFLAKHLDLALFKTLNEHAPDGAIRIWGAKAERAHQFAKMPAQNSFVLFRRGRHVFAHGVIAETTTNEKLAESLLGRDSENETWPLIFFLKRIVLVKKEAATFNLILGRKASDHWQGMTAIYVKDSPRLQAYFATELNTDA